MSDKEQAKHLVERAEKLGLHIGYEEGFLVARHSANWDPVRDDGPEIEREIIGDLGDCLGDVLDIAVGRAGSRRAADLAGARVFSVSDRAFGTLASCSSDGALSVSRLVEKNARFASDDPVLVERNVVYSIQVCIFLVPSGSPADSAGSAQRMKDERLQPLLDRYERTGLRVELDAGVLIVKYPPSETLEISDAEIAVQDLGRWNREIRRDLGARARGRMGAGFIGRSAFAPDLSAFGLISSSGDAGEVTFRYADNRTESELEVHLGGDRMLVLPDLEVRPNRVAQSEQQQESTWRRLTRRVFGD